MAIRTLGEIRTHLGSIIRDTTTETQTLITDCLNLALEEIHYYADWSSLKRKTTFSTVVDQEDYRLDEEVDRIMVVRRRSPPVRLLNLPDEKFYRYVPDPEDRGSGVPRYYRQWEETGFTTSLAADDTIQVLSSSTSDGSSFNVRLVGRNADGVVIRETINLDGTAAVASSTTWGSGSLMRVSKSADTTGVITVRRTTGATVLIRIAPTEANPRSKLLSFFPIPSTVHTVYVEYLERLHLLIHATDVPQFDTQWNWLLVQGALARGLWDFKNQEQKALKAEVTFLRGLAAMLSADGATRYDYVPVMERRLAISPSIVRRYSDSLSDAFPVYGVGAR